MSAGPGAAPEDERAARRGEYLRRRDAAEARAAALRARDRAFGNLRLLVFAVGVAVAFASLGSRLFSSAWLLPPAVAFAVLLLLHDAVIRKRERAERGVAWYRAGLARIDYAAPEAEAPAAALRAEDAPPERDGAGFADAGHPYAEDLDLFGPGSLYARMCAARTESGEARLAEWLLAPADPETVRARQAAVLELRDGLDLREDLALLGEDVRASLHPERLREWGETAPPPASPLLRVVAALLVAATLATGLAWWQLGTGPLPFAVALAVQTGFALALRARVSRATERVDARSRDLRLLATLLERLEAERFQAPLLVALAERLAPEGIPASRRIRQLVRLVEHLDARRNQLFAPIAALLLWRTRIGLALERWRAEVGPDLGAWIAAVGHFEALASIARYAWETPDQVMPELVAEGPRFEAQALGHPLIPPDRRVANDLTLARAPQALVVSGSNMSGKSTLLRAAGVAAVLAQAGAPVCARALRLSPLRVGASIHVLDSLQEGASHFYAEIRRVRQVMEIAEAEGGEDGFRALFLLDEIFHGTNSHDRGIGAEAVLRGLIERDAIGLVTTHDLALARVADAIGAGADNVHFEDHVADDGGIAFDYRMRPGVVTKSNALALMRAVGLPV